MKIIDKNLSLYSVQNHSNITYLNKPVKDLTDSVAFKSRLKTGKSLLKLTGGINSDTVKTLDKINDPLEFLKASYSLIRKTLGFSEEIAPLVTLEKLDKNLYAAYNLNSNTIYFNREYTNLAKPELFSYLRHEFRHTEQCYNALRTKGVMDKAVDMLADNTERVNLNNFRSFIKENTVDNIIELSKNNKINDEFFALALKAKQTMGKGENNYKMFEAELYEAELPLVKQCWKELQTKIINCMGIIPQDSKKAKESERLFLSMMKQPEAGSLQYCFSEHELDAFGVQGLTYIKYLLSRLL